MAIKGAFIGQYPLTSGAKVEISDLPPDTPEDGELWIDTSQETIAVTTLAPYLAQILARVNHGADANVPRPEGYAAVQWYGSVEPVNALNMDEWIEETV